MSGSRGRLRPAQPAVSAWRHENGLSGDSRLWELTRNNRRRRGLPFRLHMHRLCVSGCGQSSRCAYGLPQPAESVDRGPPMCRCPSCVAAHSRFRASKSGAQALQTAWRSEVDSNPRYGFGSLRPLSVRKLQRAKLWQRISYQNLTLTLCKQSDLDSPSVRIEKRTPGDCVVESGQLGTSLMAKPATSDSTSAQDSEFVSAGWVYAPLMTSEWATIRSEPFFHLCPRSPSVGANP